MTYRDPDAFLREYGREHGRSTEAPRRQADNGTMGRRNRASAERQDKARPSGQRPEIRITGGEISREVDAAEEALIAMGSGIFQRGELLVRAGAVSIEISDDRKTQGLRILRVEEHALLEAMTEAATWLKYDSRTKKWRPVNASPLAVKVYMSRVGRWKLPLLVGVVTAPTLRPDGSLLVRPGYDAATGLLFDPGGKQFPAIPDRPTRAAALAALGTLKSLIGTFPFVRPADRSVALSAILTAAVRRSLRTAPLHGFTAPAAGTGKSKLADLASVIATGREAGVIAQGASDEETEKRLGSLLLGAEPVIAIDNCDRPLGGEFLCQTLTQPVVRVRILGASKAPEVPANSLLTATGNNLSLLGDMTRRALLCSLDAQCERPELRQFDVDPVEVAKAERPRLVAAALTVLRAYHIAGRPEQSTPLGSFAEWSRCIRDALLWLGEPDPVSTMEDTRKLDPALETLSEAITQWHRAFGTDPVTVKAVIAKAMETQTGLGWGRSEPMRPELRDALMGVAGRGGEINNRALGIWLSKNRNRVVSGLRFTQGSIIDGNQTWRLEAVPGA